MIFSVFFKKKKKKKNSTKATQEKKKKGNLNIRLGSTYFAENTIDKSKS